MTSSNSDIKRLFVTVFYKNINKFIYFRKAVLSNPSVVGRNSISAFTSDYWGVPLSHPGSHKSYRPLTTLSFRLDWILNPAPTQFHLTNLLLHAAATLFYVRFCKLWVSPETGLIAGLIFAVHPVHTEAVAGVVGRADVLSCILFLSCLITHTKDGFSWKTSLLALLSMLAKEQGVTVLIVCAVIDLLSSQGVHQVRKSLVKLFLTFISLLCLRSIALDGNLPSFSKSDNPASHCEFIQTRTLTFLLLPALNFQLLFLPSTLSYDWSMESIPLVSSILDIRNIISTVFYSLLFYFISRVVFNFYPRIVGILKKIGSNTGESSCLSKPGEESRRKIDTIQVMALSLSLLILPFLPATNLFFYVGFVLAERVLYIPSLGYCLLLAISLENLSRFNRRCVRFGTLIMLGFFTLKTLSRNQDWRNEESLFSSGISINPAKSWSNYGNILDGAGNQAGAELAFKQALIHRNNMADTHYNLGTLLQNQGRIQESIPCYKAAIRFRPKLGVAYLNLGVALSDLGRKSEAMNILEKCSKVDDNGLKDPKENVNARISSMFHLGKLLLESKDIKGAISVLERAVNQSRGDTGNPNLEKIFNLLGECYQESGNPLEAEHWYSQSLITNPKHIPAHLTLAKMLAKNVR